MYFIQIRATGYVCASGGFAYVVVASLINVSNKSRRIRANMFANSADPRINLSGFRQTLENLEKQPSQGNSGKPREKNFCSPVTQGNSGNFFSRLRLKLTGIIYDKCFFYLLLYICFIIHNT